MLATHTALAQARTIVSALEQALGKALAHARHLTQAGQGIDAHQVHCERLAYRATELRAAQDLLRYADTAQEHGQEAIVMASMALAYSCRSRANAGSRPASPGASVWPGRHRVPEYPGDSRSMAGHTAGSRRHLAL